MRLGTPYLLETEDKQGADRIVPIARIIDGQTDELLDYITADDILHDSHKKSLETNQETYDLRTFADKRFSEHLAKRNKLLIPDEDGSLIELTIFEAHKYRDREGYKAQVYSHATYLELSKRAII